MTPMTRTRRFVTGRGFVLVLALVFTAACGRPVQETLPVLSSLPEFSLLDARGEAVSLGDLAGRPFVADFIFTRCPAACPRLTAKMKELLGRLPADTRSRLVSISVDPEHDRPHVLAAYKEKWQIRDPRWILLTGEREAVWSLVRKGFLLPVEEQDDVANPILHSNRFALVDGAGDLRGTYDAFDAAAIEKLLADLAAIEVRRAQ